MDQYEIVKQVGSGNFSKVFLVKKKEGGQCFAMKVMKTHQNIALKEAELLKRLNHPNIVKLYEFDQDILTGETRIILEYFPQNTLELYQKQQFGLKQEQIKCILFQAALGLAYVHERGIIHRDIKPENIVIDKSKAEILLIDFGLAISSEAINTDYVATRWYRAPENLLATKEYSTAIDVFSLACVIIELYIGSPLFPGADNIDQLLKIFNILGQPQQQDWPLGYKKLVQLGFQEQKLQSLEQKSSQFGLKQLLNTCEEGLFNILSKMLVLNPKRRISSKEIVLDEYFSSVSNIIPPHIYSRFQKDFLKKQSKPDIIDSVQTAINHSKNMLSRIHSNFKPIPSFLKQSHSPTSFPNPNISQINSMPVLVSSARFEHKGSQQISSNAQRQPFQQQRARINLRESQPEQNKKELESVLSFRGFNPVKNNKLSMNEIKKYNDVRISRQKSANKIALSREQVLNVSGTFQHPSNLKHSPANKTVDVENQFIYTANHSFLNKINQINEGNQINQINKIYQGNQGNQSNQANHNKNAQMNLMSQIKGPVLVSERKLTTQVSRPSLTLHALDTSSSQTFHYVNNRVTPVKYNQNMIRGVESPQHFLAQEPRISRNNSILNVQGQKSANTSFTVRHSDNSTVRQSDNSALRQRISLSPIAVLTPSRNSPKIQQVLLQQNKPLNLYTQKLHSNLSERNLIPNKPNLLYKDTPHNNNSFIDRSKEKNASFIEKLEHGAARNEFYALLKNYAKDRPNDIQKQAETPLKVKMNPVKTKYSHLKTQTSGKQLQVSGSRETQAFNKIRHIKSLERKDLSEQFREETFPDKFSLNQMKFLKGNETKSYREPYVSVRREVEDLGTNRKMDGALNGLKDERNISINLNLSIIQAEKAQSKVRMIDKRHRI